MRQEEQVLFHCRGKRLPRDVPAEPVTAFGQWSENCLAPRKAPSKFRRCRLVEHLELAQLLDERRAT